MLERREGYFQGHNKEELFYQTWSSPNTRGTIVLTHGMSEHSEVYNQTAEKIVAMGWNVCAWDLRGHGRSEGRRGCIDNFHDFSLDLISFIQYLQKSDRIQGPLVLLGHSMGGLITLRASLDASASIKPKAMVFSSPLLGFGLEIPAIKDFAARILNRILPTVTMYNEINYADLSRDIEWQKACANDPLRHEKISAPIYLGMIEGMSYIKAHASEIKTPVLFLVSGEDRVVSPAATKEFFSKIGSKKKELIVYPDSRHELFNDFDRDKAFSDLQIFLDQFIIAEPK
jgi:alpha-beta hydrolase superfamily lysophospholipase